MTWRTIDLRNNPEHANAYQLGRDACRTCDGYPSSALPNPYAPGSATWQAWNKGWNSYWDDAWNRESEPASAPS